MRSNPVKRKVLSGERSVGTFVLEFNSPGLARLAAGAGAEFVVLDMEHTGWSIETVRQLIATCGGAKCVPFVRVPATEYHFIARVLDVGALGIMVPMVHTSEQAEQIAAAGRYPPHGQRGAAFGIAHDDYTGGDIVAKMQLARERTLLIAQIESVQGVENAEAIAAVEGIDVLWIGHFDLTCSQNIPGQFDHPRFQEAVAHVVDVARQAGKAAGMLVTSVEDGLRCWEQGFQILAYGGDLWLYQNALQQGVDALRQ